MQLKSGQSWDGPNLTKGNRNVTIKITVRYFNYLSSIMGTKEEIFEEKAGITLIEFTRTLAVQNSPQFQEAVLLDGKIRDHLRIFLNERLVNADQYNEQLEDGDQIMLFPAVAGG
jgi:MoaD family protein